MTLKPCSVPLQSLANLAEVVDLTIEDDPVPRLRIVHGLMTEGREIENGQAAVAQSNLDGLGDVVTQDDSARIVGAAMSQGKRRSLEYLRIDSALGRNNPDDSAHCGLHSNRSTSR